jgi:two-component system, NarL family, response regulator DesR
MASRIVLCDESSTFHGRLAAAVEGEGDLEIVGNVRRVAELQPLLASCPADVVLLDIDGDDGLPAVADVAAEANVVVVSGCDEPGLVQQVLQAGALGCLHRDAASDEMLRLLRRALDGMTAITGEHALRVAESLRRRRSSH